jgi:hypothetical protein
MRAQQQQPPANPHQQAEQLALLADEDVRDAQTLERQIALETYLRSPLLRRQYSSFEVLMASPVTGRSVRVGAAAIARKRLMKTRGR